MGEAVTGTQGSPQNRTTVMRYGKDRDTEENDWLYATAIAILFFCFAAAVAVLAVLLLFLLARYLLFAL